MINQTVDTIYLFRDNAKIILTLTHTCEIQCVYCVKKEEYLLFEFL